MRKTTLALVSSFALAAGLSACAPRTALNAVAGAAPVLFKVSGPAVIGRTVTVQGRYLGGQGSRVTLGRDPSGQDGTAVPGSAVLNFSDSSVSFTVPDGTPQGGTYVFVEANGMRSNGLPFNVAATAAN